MCSLDDNYLEPIATHSFYPCSVLMDANVFRPAVSSFLRVVKLVITRKNYSLFEIQTKPVPLLDYAG